MRRGKQAWDEFREKHLSEIRLRADVGEPREDDVTDRSFFVNEKETDLLVRSELQGQFPRRSVPYVRKDTPWRNGPVGNAACVRPR